MKFFQSFLMASIACIINCNALPLSCKPIESLENGFVVCPEGGMDCITACKRGYTMTGNAWLTCRKTSSGPQWSELPTCTKEVTCEATPLAPANGFVLCSNGATLGSFCFYGCNEGYKLEGSELTSCTKTLENSAEWDVHSPKCVPRERCQANKKADVVIAIDSSIAFGKQNFETAKDFVFEFINSFSNEENMTRFSLFRYNKDIDTTSQILFNDFEDRNQMLNAIEKIPNRPEKGTSTGLALRHISNVILSESNGARPGVQNIVILFTGSVSNDDVARSAQELRTETGSTLVYTVGISPSEPTKHEDYQNQMNAITNSPQNVIVRERFSFGHQFSQALFQKIGNLVCKINL